MCTSIRNLLIAVGGIVSIFGTGSSFAGPLPKDTDIARFLNHASFGATQKDIEEVKKLGSFEAYLDKQFEMPLPEYPIFKETSDITPDASICNSICVRDTYSAYPLQIRFFRNAITAPDQLRQRVAFALSQILVVSARNAGIRQPSRLLPYLKLLDKHAFGNYRQLLEEITLNPAMGKYLNMAGNLRSAPNENYARELLQLFSIGLVELNKDGTVKKSKSGQAIPTYSQSTINNFSRVFTGWDLATSTENPALKSYSAPMIENPSYHDPKEKTLFGNTTIPATTPATNASMSSELDAALDNIFQHPNVAPFISKQLIQHLVASNPTPAYVGRVATVFQNSGGDMKSVIKAILLDKEALKPPSKSAGHLRSPVLWLTHLLRAFNINETTTDFALTDSTLTSQHDMLQDVYRAPTVFNYYPADYQVPNTKLQGPEFAIYSTKEAINRANLAYDIIYRKMPTNTDTPKGTWIPREIIQSLPIEAKTLVTALVTRMMPEGMNSRIQKVLTEIVAKTPDEERVQNAIYWIATSPQFLIEK